jgi:hypothetical protein
MPTIPQKQKVGDANDKSYKHGSGKHEHTMYVLWPYVSGAYWSLLPAAAGVCCLLVPPAGVCCWRLLRGLWLLVCFACCLSCL